MCKKPHGPVKTNQLMVIGLITSSRKAMSWLMDSADKPANSGGSVYEDMVS